MTSAYQEGVRAMAAGRYREAVLALQAARELAPCDPQVKLWLVMAYEANQQRELAHDLCRELTGHPDPRIRQESQRVLYILEAPQLQRRADWLTPIPLLTDEPSPSLMLGKPRQVIPRETSPGEVIYPVQNNTFVPVTLGGLLVLLLLWAGWG